MNGGESLMRPEHVDETLLVKYLLGNLTEQEQVPVEDRAFADPEYLGALEAAEADLIDAYVRGELEQTVRRNFEQRFLTSPGRIRKVEFARTLAKVAAESKTEWPSAWQTLISLVRGWSPMLQLATAVAGLLLVAGGSWLVVQSTILRSRVTTLEAQHREFEVQRREFERREEGLRREVAAQQQKRQPPAALRTLQPVVASLIFVPGQTRSETRAEQLVLAADAQIAHVEIQIEERDDYARFRAELRTRGGQEVVSLNNLPRKRTGPGQSVSFDVPASVLAAGEYELTLKGIAGNQSTTNVGYYYFRVQRQ